jgi:hypothetical protein
MATQKKGNLNVFDTVLAQCHDVCTALLSQLMGPGLLYNVLIALRWDDSRV